MTKFKNKGFTLLELMVVIGIIVVISTIAVVAFNNSRSKARDTQRMSDLRAIQDAIELYIEDNKLAPDPLEETWAGLAALVVPYMQGSELPKDPQDSEGYRYVYCRFGHNYLLAGVMENEQEIANDFDTDPGYNLASECIFSGTHTDSLNCADLNGSGNIAGILGSVFCFGYAKD